MKITRNRIFAAIVVFGLMTNLLVYFNVQFFYLRQIFSFLFLTIIPGLLIMLALKIRKLEFWEYLVYTIGLSLTFLMFGGLLVNWVLPLISISNPLSLRPISITLSYVMSVIGILAYFQSKDISYEIKLAGMSALNWIFSCIPVLFVPLSIFGAVSLNNGGSNIFTMILLGGIAGYVFLVAIFQKKLDSNIYPLAIVLMSISLLLMYSLRSWHISGWDINEEYRIFQITKSAGYWSPDLIKHTYNSCLSLTILPTIISRITNVNDEYIYKVIYQLIFSIVPVTMYCIYKKYTSAIVSFLAVFFFIAQPLFIQPMPALARQEIAFLFFTLTLLVIFTKNITQKTKDFMFVLFGFSMIVAHYSTTYVAIGIYLLSYIILLVYKKTVNLKFTKNIYTFFRLRNQKDIPITYNLRFIPIILIILFTFLWGTQLTKSANDLFQVINKTTLNMKQMFSADMRSEEIQASLSIFSVPNDNTLVNIHKYINEMTMISDRTINSSYKYNTFLNVQLLPVNEIQVKPKIIIPFTSQFFNFLDIVKLLTRVFVIIGIFYLVFSKLNKTIVDRDYLVLCLVGVGVILMMYILPIISQDYNLTRLYLQILILLSLPTIYGCFLLLRFINEKLRLYLIGVIFILYFLCVSGYFFQLFGGYAYMHLNNFGYDYDKFYSHQSEVNSAVWLSKHRDIKSPIFADEFAALRLYSFGQINSINYNIVPSVITKNSYVYSSYANIVRGRTDVEYRNMSLVYTFPLEFLNENKNLIYNNGSSEVFK